LCQLWHNNVSAVSIVIGPQGWPEFAIPAQTYAFYGMTSAYFKDDQRRKGPWIPNSRLYQRIKKLRTDIERCYDLVKENRYPMEANNTYRGHNNVLIYVIEHNTVAILGFLREHRKTVK